ANAILAVGKRHQRAGRGQEAVSAYRKILTLEPTLRAQPGNLWTSPAASLNLADVLQATGRTEEAVTAYRQALARFERATTTSCQDSSFWLSYYAGFTGLAAILENKGRVEELTALQHKALDIFAEFAAEIPDDPLYHEALARVSRSLPLVVKDRGPVTSKEALYRRALEVTRQSAARFPNQADYVFRVAYWQSNLGDVLWAVGRTREAEETFRDAAAGYRTFLDREPDHVKGLNNLAWLLVTCPATTLQDGREALELVRKAIALQSEEHYHHNTLGIAYYR